MPQAYPEPAIRIQQEHNSSKGGELTWMFPAARSKVQQGLGFLGFSLPLQPEPPSTQTG